MANNRGLDQKEMELVTRVVHRFINLNLGTPIDYLRRSLGKERFILDELMRMGYLEIFRSDYLPTFRAIHEVCPEVEPELKYNVHLVLSVLQRLYKSSDSSSFSAQQIFEEFTLLDRSRDNKDFWPAFHFAASLGFFSSIGYSNSEDGKIQISTVSVVEKILDYENIDSELEKIVSTRRATHVKDAKTEVKASVGDDQYDLSFISHTTIRAIVMRDLAELKKITAAGATLSRLILIGRILEGLLLDALLRNENKAQLAKKAPKERGQPKPLNEWVLSQLIDVSVELGFIRSAHEKLGHTVREYRNLVHPGLEVRGDLVVRENEANIAQEFLNIVILDLPERSK